MFDWIERRGRLGGLLGFILGLGLLLFCLLDAIRTGSYFVYMALLGIVFTAIGLINLIFGGGGASRSAKKKRKKKHMSPSKRKRQTDLSMVNLERELSKHSFPYVLCMANGIVVTDSARHRDGKDPCAHCRPALDHMEICDYEDLKIALVSMEK